MFYASIANILQDNGLDRIEGQIQSNYPQMSGGAYLNLLSDGDTLLPAKNRRRSLAI